MPWNITFAQPPLNSDWTPATTDSEISLPAGWAGDIITGQTFQAYFTDKDGKKITGEFNTEDSNLVIITPPRMSSVFAWCIKYYPPDHKKAAWLLQNAELGESGTYTLGPYHTKAGDPPGKYTFRIGLLCQDAMGKTYWAEIKIIPGGVNQTTTVPTTVIETVDSSPKSAVTIQQDNSQNKTPPPSIEVNWFFYSLSGLLVLVGGVLGYLVARVNRKLSPALTPVAQTKVADYTEPIVKDIPKVSQIESKAKLILQDNSEICIRDTSTAIGRSDFETTLPLKDLLFITKGKHILISYEEGKYYIEDLKSSNGTKLNDVDIKGKGKFELHNGDKVRIAEVVNLTFKCA